MGKFLAANEAAGGRQQEAAVSWPEMTSSSSATATATVSCPCPCPIPFPVLHVILPRLSLCSNELCAFAREPRDLCCSVSAFFSHHIYIFWSGLTWLVSFCLAAAAAASSCFRFGFISFPLPGSRNLQPNLEAQVSCIN